MVRGQTTGRTQAAGIMFGLAVGDALGVPFEFQQRDTFECDGMVGYGTHNQPAGTWSDDTAMSLATLDSLINNDGRVDENDLRGRYVDWLKHGKYTPDGKVFDCGTTVHHALHQGYGESDVMSNGNGSLMRIASCALFDLSDDDVRRVSAVTHAHPTSMDACVEHVHALRRLIEGDDIMSVDPHASRDTVKSGGYVLDTLNAAQWCFATTLNYRDCVLAAVNLGSDTDTTACVAGALAGAFYELEDIPDEWLDALRGKEIIMGLLDRLDE